MTALPSKHCSGYQELKEADEDHRTPGNETWGMTCGQQSFKYRWRKMEATAQDRAG